MRSRCAEASAASVDTIPACAGSGNPRPAMQTMRRPASSLRSRAIMQISRSLLMGAARASVPAMQRVGKSGRRVGGAEKRALAARVIQASPELPALGAARARGHLDAAGGAGRRGKIARRREPQQRPLLLRGGRAAFPQQLAPADQLDVLAAGA